MNQLRLITLLYPLTSLILLGLFSLLVGSFLNVVIYRLPLMMSPKRSSPTKTRRPATCSRDPAISLNAQIKSTEIDRNESREQVAGRRKLNCQHTFNLCFPRSHCPHCLAIIPIWHNIPIFSYLWLRGRCHHCQHRIDWTYPLVEFFSLTLSMLAGYYFGFTATLCFALLLIWFSLCLTFIDLKQQLLPDCLTLGLLWIGLIANTQQLWTTLPDAVWSAAGAYVSLWLLIKLFYCCTGKIGMGHGDFKLFAAFAAWFGWHSLIPILLISSSSGSIIGLIYLTATGKHKNTPLPFGPFLCLGGIGYLFFTMLK